MHPLYVAFALFISSWLTVTRACILVYDNCSFFIISENIIVRSPKEKNVFWLKYFAFIIQISASSSNSSCRQFAICKKWYLFTLIVKLNLHTAPVFFIMLLWIVKMITSPFWAINYCWNSFVVSVKFIIVTMVSS